MGSEMCIRDRSIMIEDDIIIGVSDPRSKDYMAAGISK